MGQSGIEPVCTVGIGIIYVDDIMIYIIERGCQVKGRAQCRFQIRRHIADLVAAFGHCREFLFHLALQIFQNLLRIR